jgi:hypothetical protein
MGGVLDASGRGLTNPASVTRTWWSAGALARLGVRLGDFSVELEAGATIPLADRAFKTTTPDVIVGQTPTISPMVAFGLSRSL